MGAAMDLAARQQIAFLRQRIAELEGRTPAPPNPRDRFAAVVDVVCAEFGVERELLLGVTRQAEVTLARHAAMALAQRCLAYSLPRIGRLLHRDHTTVLHGVRRITRLAEEDAAFAARLDRLATLIRNRRPPA
jgi:chromosomal replication initiation ATPase DnaA